jgi:hypothetical protein
MPNYFVDTGTDNQLQIEAPTQMGAIEKFMHRVRWQDCLEVQPGRPYEGWSAVTFYVSPAKTVCANADCNEIPLNEGETFCDDCQCYHCGGGECGDVCKETED